MRETFLLQQTLLLSAAVLALALLRPVLKRFGGPAAVLTSWLAVPAALVAPWLPQPQAALLPAAWQVSTEAMAAPALALPAANPSSVSPWLTAWLAGVLMLSLLLLWRQVRFLRSGPRLAAGASPAWVGLWRGRLWLPRDFRRRFTPEERRLIRAHERAHAQRGDNLWTLLATGLWLLHWFNPLAWWALRRLRADQELAADAQVLRQHPQALAGYLRTLAKAEAGAPPALAVSPFAPHPLIERIRWMKAATHRQSRPWLALLVGTLMLGSAWALNPAQAPEPAAGGQGQTAPFVVSVRMGDRQVDQQRVQVGADGAASLRVSSFGDKDLLITLQAKPVAKGLEQLSAVLLVGFPQSSSTELRSDLAPGEPLQTTIQDPARKQGSVTVRIARDLPLEERWPLDPDQSGQVAFDIQAFVDGKPVDSQQLQAPLGGPLPLMLGATGPLPIKGSVRTTARLSGAMDLRFELAIAGRTITPRVVTQNGVKATIETNSTEEPRVVRLEVTPRRIKP